MTKQIVTERKTPIFRIKAVREGTVTYQGLKQIVSPGDVYGLAKTMIEDEDREVFICIYLDTKHKIIGVETVAIGSLNSCFVHPRELFKGALFANAAAIVIAHNHPSGDPTPSQEDQEITERILSAGEILGIKILDHLVIGENCYKSIRETTFIWGKHQYHQ